MVRLSDAQQERYARHLLLDGIGGEGQERLLAASVRVRGTGAASYACSFYLAASGVGALAIPDPCLGAELRALSPHLRLLPVGDHAVDLELDPDGESPPGAGPAEAASSGAWTALLAIRELSRTR